MEYSPQSLRIDTHQHNHIKSSKMSTLTMSAPHHHVGFHREFTWQEPRVQTAPRSQEEHSKIALPSIRQAFPELQLHIQQESSSRSSTTAGVSPATSPTYLYSTGSIKRRRLSIESEHEVASKVPRLYDTSQVLPARHNSPPQTWRDSHHIVMKSIVPASQPSMTPETRSPIGTRPTLPSLPHLNFDRRTSELPRLGSISSDEYAVESARRASLVPGMGQREAISQQSELRSVSASYDYRPMHRGQPPAVPSSHQPYERSPFTPGVYNRPYHHRDPYMRINEHGGPQGNENKQRKRRGNLPKETTDKLRAWFVSHLQHPYPTEDEKQDLMRQTGLQMNQISNWFINARRRQLPTMINNARAESDAMSSRDNDDRILPSTERDVYGNSKRITGHLSDGEGSLYDEELSHHGSTSHIQRGSI